MQRFSLRTSDPEVAASSVNTLFGSPLTFEHEPAKNFQCNLDGLVTSTSFTMARITLPPHIGIDSGELPGYSVSFARAGATRWRVGRQQGTFDVPLLLPPQRRLEMTNSDFGSDTVTLGFSAGALESHIGSSERRVADGAALSVPRNSSAAMATFLSYVGTMLDSVPEVFENALIRAGLVDAAMSLMLTSFDLEKDQRSASSTMPRTLRRAITFIDENLAEPISVADIATAARLSVRGLQGLFERELGLTPTRYLRRARLNAVRRELLAADAGSTRVSDVAHRWGFVHLPRFAQDYRAAYGELPSTTLQG